MNGDVDPVQLAEDLRAAVGTLVRSARQVDRLPAGEAAALGVLDRDGPCTTAQLAHRRRVRHQSMAKIVRRLAEAGLVERFPHNTDGRMVLLRITPVGRRILDDERAHRTDWLASAIVGELSLPQRSQLALCVPLLAKLAEAGRDPGPRADGAPTPLEHARRLCRAPTTRHHLPHPHPNTVTTIDQGMFQA
jgi:DNA-binding MarR family transcriptional regulator